LSKPKSKISYVTSGENTQSTLVESEPGISAVFKHDNEFKDKVKLIIDQLSIKFKGDKDYPEWEKSVKAIFIDESSKPDDEVK